MESHLVLKTVLETLKAKSASEEHRNRYTADLIKKVTDEARHIGPSAAAKKFKVPQACVWRWFDAFKDSGFKVYCRPKKRGRESLLSDNEASGTLSSLCQGSVPLRTTSGL